LPSPTIIEMDSSTAITFHFFVNNPKQQNPIYSFDRTTNRTDIRESLVFPSLDAEEKRTKKKYLFKLNKCNTIKIIKGKKNPNLNEAILEVPIKKILIYILEITLQGNENRSEKK
jgi:hypothetical protein